LSLQPEIKQIQHGLTGFLDKDAPAFCREMWNLLLSAQESSNGIPKELLEAKKAEIQQVLSSTRVPGGDSQTDTVMLRLEQRRHPRKLAGYVKKNVITSVQGVP
jgi:hypothetical protein